MPKKMFKEFDIEIPKFLQAPAWADESWGNDVTAHVRHIDLPKESDYELWVWVAEDNPAERESHDMKKFSVSIYERETGDELESFEAETEAECQKHIETALWRINFLAENAKNNQNPE